MKTITRIAALAAVCALALCPFASAADDETLYNADYCFSEADFTSDAFSEISGIFVTAVPEKAVAAIKLGNREIRAGDILPAEVLERLRLVPACGESCNAELSYQPICGTALGDPAAITIRIQSGKNETPKAIGGEFETYKNIANDGKLTGSDPEEAPLTFQLVEKPKRGTLTLNTDGSYVYTPDKNKVGEDSFTFTVTDDAGNVSKPATVKIKILKPSQSMTFADMEGNNDQYEAVWVCNEGLSSGRSIAGTLCFCPQETVSRAEFLVMAMKLEDIPVDAELTVSGFADAEDSPAWVQPYVASAMRRGIISGETGEAGAVFRPNDAITGREAAVILQNILKLPVSAAAFRPSEGAWSATAMQALSDAGISLSSPEQPLTRIEAACLLYQAAQLN